MRSKLCICSILLLTGLGIGRASPQVCTRELSFAGSPTRLIFGLGFNSSAQTYHGGLRVGGERVFGEAEFGMATYDVGATPEIMEPVSVCSWRGAIQEN